MKDATHYSTEINKHMRELEELLAYMAPTALQVKRIKELAYRIAVCASIIHEFAGDN